MISLINKILLGFNKSSLIQEFDDKFITIQYEKFYHDRKDLIKLIEKVPKKRLMVEVGSLVGFSTRLFSNYFDKVISVDPYSPGYDQSDGNSSKNRLLLAQHLFKIRFFDDPKVSQINMHSKDAAENFKNESLDFVYIDGAHDYDSVKSDILSWKPKIRKNSYIAGDDYDDRWPGLKEAVAEQLPNHEVVGGERWIAKIT